MSDSSDIMRRFIEDRDAVGDEELAALVATLRASPQLAAELKEQLVIDDLLAQQLDLTRWRFLAQMDQRIRDLGDSNDVSAGVLPWTTQPGEVGGRPAPAWQRWARRWMSLAAGILLGLGAVAAYWTFDRFAREVAVIETADDRVTLIHAGQGAQAEAAAAIRPGDRLLTGPESSATVRYRDGTLVQIEERASVAFRPPAAGAGKTIWIERGGLSAQVAPQPSGEPMLFDSRGATTRVLGTSLSVRVAGDETRVQVREGRVQLTRKSDGKALTIAGGELAVSAPKTFLAAPIAWPGNRQGLVFLFETNDKPNLVRSSTTGVNRSYSVRPRGDAHLNRDYAMVLTGGAFLAEDADGEILSACRQTNELTIEATVMPSLAEQQGPARIVTFSTDIVNRDFTLGQLGDELIIRIRTPQTGPNGVGGVEPGLALCKLTAGEPNHVIVSYRPGRIICYLNGQQVFEGDQIEGDFRDWSAQHLLFGDEYGGERNWAGALEGVAIYNRFMPADEAQRNALEYEHLRQSRRPTPQVLVLAELVAKSKIPAAEQILPHRSALAVSKYRVKQALQGDLPDAISADHEILVAQWALLDARKQPIADLQPGAEVELLLEPFDRNPQIQRYLCSDDFQPDAGGRRLFEVRALNETPDSTADGAEKVESQATVSKGCPVETIFETLSTFRHFAISQLRVFAIRFLGLPIFATGLAWAATSAADDDGTTGDRLRVIVETDAGGDPDDEQSLVRFLLYANEWDVEGIIANRREVRRPENRNPGKSGFEIVRRFIEAYETVYPRLREHDERYPAPAALRKRTVAGYDDTDEAVRLVIETVDRDDARPVWFLNWGTDHGSAESNLKRALDRVLAERGREGYAKFKQKFLLCSDDQFGEHTARIKPLWRLWVYPFYPNMDGGRWYHRFGPLTATAGGFDLERDVRTNHGPLGALYPTNTGIQQKEGDSYTFLYLIPTGMNEALQPAWGSWAGRFGVRSDWRPPNANYYWAGERDAWRGSTHRDNTLRRWAADLQNDFRARMDWCVQTFAKANHPPQAVLNGDASQRVLTIDAAPGASVQLSAAESSDPDGDELEYEWFVYPEAGTYGGKAELSATSPETRFVVPPDAAGKTIHLIVAVRDRGAPPLARYRRAVLHGVQR